MKFQKSKERFDRLKACVIIPTYNNSSTLFEVISSVQEYTNNIIVVNDGSSDNSGDILKKLVTIEVLSFKKNKGKGWALRKGFQLANKKGYWFGNGVSQNHHRLP